MKSTYKLIWSDEALRNLKGIIGYLKDRWTEKEIRNFSQLLDKNRNSFEATLIYSHPVSVFPIFEKPFYHAKPPFIIALLISGFKS